MTEEAIECPLCKQLVTMPEDFDLIIKPPVNLTVRKNAKKRIIWMLHVYEDHNYHDFVTYFLEKVMKVND